jgi:hypothetical protein
VSGEDDIFSGRHTGLKLHPFIVVRLEAADVHEFDTADIPRGGASVLDVPAYGDLIFRKEAGAVAGRLPDQMAVQRFGFSRCCRRRGKGMRGWSGGRQYNKRRGGRGS